MKKPAGRGSVDIGDHSMHRPPVRQSRDVALRPPRRRAAGDSAGRVAPRSRPFRQDALVDLRRTIRSGCRRFCSRSRSSSTPRSTPSTSTARRRRSWRCGARKTVGRILVSDDPNYNELHGTNVGCFGMFESIDEPAVTHGLLDAAADWLRARGGPRSWARSTTRPTIRWAC